MKPIWRAVESHYETHNPGFHKSRYVGGNFWLKLETCGHVNVRKISQGVPQKVRCKDCEARRAGSVSNEYDVDKREKTTERWNAALGAPCRTIAPMTDEEVRYWGRGA